MGIKLVGQFPKFGWTMTDDRLLFLALDVILGAHIFHFMLNSEEELPDRRERAARKRMEEQCTMKYLQME